MWRAERIDLVDPMLLRIGAALVQTFILRSKYSEFQLEVFRSRPDFGTNSTRFGSDRVGSGRVGSDRIGSDPPPHQCRPRARPHSGQEPKRNRRKSSAHGRKRPLQAVRSPASAPAAKVDQASAVEGLGSSRQRHHAKLQL